ncbi:hepatoma-derived growth factor-related protein 2-like [Paramacrobiotus metropolitanus]|uniref:hepatoma-derived growth factor-related protein 2-like n=1 Tax=Paramacrobiotus metropolitanus TaxID=2943436 RepID=UPI00244578FC|nr:hepatoma-derived growth factor-related protein 2-like [Paramacrobiotus metropolitanus]
MAGSSSSVGSEASAAKSTKSAGSSPGGDKKTRPQDSAVKKEGKGNAKKDGKGDNKKGGKSDNKKTDKKGKSPKSGKSDKSPKSNESTTQPPPAEDKEKEKPKKKPEPPKPEPSKLAKAPKIYASAYSDAVWIMLKDYAKDVLRNSPTDVLAFSADYFAKKVDQRRNLEREFRSQMCAKRKAGKGTTPAASPAPSTAASSVGEQSEKSRASFASQQSH